MRERSGKMYGPSRRKMYAPRMGSGGPAATALQVDAERKVENERAARRGRVEASIAHS